MYYIYVRVCGVCSNLRGTSYSKLHTKWRPDVFSILETFIASVNEIIGDYHYELRCNRSVVDHRICI
jgi:hypothetical protein